MFQQRPLKWLLGAMVLATNVTLHAQMAQDPLLSRTAAVEPNIVFVFDDSASMISTAIYQFGGGAGYQGNRGPNNDAECLGGSGCIWTNPPATLYGQSPDVNLIYYDPRVTYKLRVNADGTSMAAGPTTSISSWKVYFYKPPTTGNTYNVNTVTVVNKGADYPATGITATFPAPPAGGTQAAATIQTGTSPNVASVTVTDRGRGYPASGVTATFSPPAAGGTTATGTVQIGSSFTVTGVTLNAAGSDYPATGVTASFSAPTLPGGVTATATVNMDTSSKKVTGATPTSLGSGYTSAPTVAFAAAPAGGTTATGTAVLTSTRKVNTIAVASGGCYTTGGTATLSGGTPLPGTVAPTFTVSYAGTAGVCTGSRRAITGITVTGGSYGYTGTPTVSVSGAQTAGTFSVVMSAASNVVSGITITNPGSGYLVNPAITFTGGGGSGAAYTSTTAISNRVASISLANPGVGYTGVPTITINAASGSGAAATAVTGSTNSVIGITMTNRGSGYSSVPTITLSSAGTSPATLAPVLGTTNVITGVTVTNSGSGYLSSPTLVLSPLAGAAPGTGATFSYTYNTIPTQPDNRRWDGTGSATTAADYFSTGTPAGFTPNPSVLSSTATVVAYPNVTGSGYTYPKFRDRTDCAGTVCTWAEELQNYANWKRYHSNRLDLAKTGIGLAFQPLNPTFRLGWGTLGQISGQGSTSGQCGATTAALAKGVRLYNSGTQSDFLTWLYAINGNVLCTPSRVALDNVGKYYQRADAAGPWANTPAGSGTISVAGIEAGHASCRRAYSMLMTDGYYNDSFSLGGTGDADSTAGPNITQPRAYQYAPIGPYSDNVTSTTKYLNTLADVAMKYWVNDLRPDLANGVKPVTGDEGFWQHMNFYAIGLGLIGTLDATDPAVLQALSGNAPARTLNWPTPAGNDPKAIDDMWHATVNGRGKLLNAKTADELNRSIQQMMSDIGGKEGTQSGVAVSTISLTKDTRKYTPMYTPVSWTGNVIAYNLDQANANQSTIAWQVETETSIDPVTGVKTFSSRLPSHDLRKIYVGNGAASGARAVPFKFADMPSGLLTSMGGVVTTGLIDYLRGDKTDEDNSATTSSPTAIYRPRQTGLGDVVNSTPVFVKDSLDMKYELLPSSVTGQDTYRAFVAAKKARTEGVLFVGANDGMLHAFRDGTYNADDTPRTPGGIEVFAYVPNALLPTIRKLADKTYAHQYYVDGPNSETDAYLASKSGWANIVLGSTGAGAGALAASGVSPRAAVFAIDATAINSSPSALDAASTVLWEVSSNLSAFAELGYVLTDIQAGVTVGGQWVAVFGNGYESKSCQARLFVVNLDTGALIREINTGAGACSAGNKNGLGGVRLVRNGNQQVVGVYAGDLLGNMWKFNLNNTSSGSWGVDLSGQPLMKTGTTKPITAPPSVLSLPLIGTTDPKPGYMVVFGTGKFYEVPDITTTATQSLHGIWDKLDFGTTVIPTGSALTDTSMLVQQTIGAGTTTTSGNTYFAVSTNAVAYTGASAKRGWFINLPQTGQRLIYPLDILADRFVVADTMSPNNVSTDPCSNVTGGVGYLYIIDALDGAGPSRPVLDTNGDGNVDSTDMVVSGLEGRADGRNVSIIVSKNELATTYANVGGGTPGATIIKIGCELTNTCAIPSPGVRHQWRQLFLR